MMNKTVLLVLIVLASILAEIDSKEILARGVSKEERQMIINTHNELRLLLQRGKVPNQPKSVDMRKLCWDDDLAKAAQRIADDMTFKHQMVYDDRWSHVGQNLAEKSATRNRKGADWKWAINAWFDEVRFYTYGNMPIRGTGHYTQIAWATTTHVGCGYTHFIDFKQRVKYMKLYVCNYGPGGNVFGVKPYNTVRM